MDLAAGAGALHGPVLGRLATHDQVDNLPTLGQRLDGKRREALPATADPDQRDVMVSSGFATKARVAPGWSFCPPGFFPLDWRSCAAAAS